MPVYAPGMMLPHLPQAVVFDMDGLLFDTETLYEEAILAAGREAGLHVTPALFRRLIGNPWGRNRELLLEQFGSERAVETLREGWLRQFEALVPTRLALKPGAAELLHALQGLGIPCAIATSSARPVVERLLALHGSSARFGAIAAAGEYRAGKPAPDPFLLAAARLGVAPARCLALEDSHNGVRSAAAAGMVTVMVPDLLEPTPEIEGLCAAILPDLHAVRRLIERAASG